VNTAAFIIIIVLGIMDVLAAGARHSAGWALFFLVAGVAFITFGIMGLIQ
jgi:hypothetical protein